MSRSVRSTRTNFDKASSSERLVRELLGKADIEIGGSAEHDLVVHDRRFFACVVRDGSMGLGESYMEGWWDSPAIDEMVTRLHRANIPDHFRKHWRFLASLLTSRLFNLQRRARAFEVGKRHYDIGNDLYRRMLDRRMTYTCAYWKGAETLDAAQEAKLDLVCRKLGLCQGMSVLDLGCGWASFAKYASETYDVSVTGYTVSNDQFALGRELCADLPVNILLEDYRNATGTYDRVVSIGLMEHVGYKNYRKYMQIVDRCLAPDGISLIHTIGAPRSGRVADPWMRKYIFPNFDVPSVAQLAGAMEGLFTFEDLHSFGPHYDQTLMAWHANIKQAWPELRPKYGERFGRMWTYYLLLSAAAFRARYLNLFQIVMTKQGAAQPDRRT